MELDEFVATTLEQIIKGIISAQNVVRGLGTNAAINPAIGIALPPDKLDDDTGTLLGDGMQLWR